ncbi:MAG: hypothetical protein ABJK28_12575 [Algibacter sp.]
MKKKLLLSFIVLISLSGFSQQLYMEYGSTISSFDYENSRGESLDNLLSRSKSYIAMGYRKDINNAKTMFLNLGASYNNYGAIGSYNALDNYFEWDISYLGVNAGIDIRLFQLRDLSFYFKAALTSEFLIRGNQTINNDVYNLVGADEFNGNILFARGGVMMHYPVTSNTAIYMNYTYGKTALINSGENAEKLKLNAHQFGIGFIINLPNCYCDN